MSVPLLLRFEPELESAYREQYARESLAHVRVMMVVAAGVTLAFTHWDHLLFPDVADRLWRIRAWVLAPVMLGTVASTFVPGLSTRWPTLVALTVFVAIGGLSAMLPIVPFDAAQTHVFPGVQLVIMFAFGALKLPFLHALVASAAAIAGYFLVGAGHLGFPQAGLVNAGYFVGGSFASGALASFMLERYSRQSFLQRRENDRLLETVEEARRHAEDASRSKTRFLAAASHDLRQPMHTIGLLVDLLRDRLPEGEDKSLADRVHRAAHAMESLIESLLDVSRFDAGIVPVRRETFALAPVLRSLEARYGPLAEAKGLRLEIEACRDFVESDRVLVERMLGNLVDNAIRYTDQGEVGVRCERRGDGLRITVRDSGRGISIDQQTRVFEEFYQVENPERDRSQGLGLGLSIVRRASELLGHPIALHSELGRGSVFSFDLPLAGPPDRSPALDEVDAVVASASETSPNGGANTIGATAMTGAFVVVIEDERDVREALGITLRQWGCIPLLAESGAEAIERLASHLRDPDLILCDDRLRAGESGVDAIRSLRAVLGRDVPGLLVSGNTSPEDLARIAAAGLPALTKPIHGPALRRRLAELLEADRLRSGTVRKPGA